MSSSAFQIRPLSLSRIHDNLLMRPQPPGDRWLRLIALFKLIKGMLLVAAGIGALRLLHRDVADVVERWIDVLRVDPDNRFIHSVLVKVLTVNDRSLKEISAGTFAYAALFLTEGTGLLLRKRWAQYFTIIVTGSFLASGSLRVRAARKRREAAGDSSKRRNHRLSCRPAPAREQR